MSVTCKLCGDTWLRDPALEVACPRCHAPAGSPCQRPSGHGCDVHPARDGLALELGFLRPCPMRSSRLIAEEVGLPLFAGAAA